MGKCKQSGVAGKKKSLIQAAHSKKPAKSSRKEVHVERSVMIAKEVMSTMTKHPQRASKPAPKKGPPKTSTGAKKAVSKSRPTGQRPQAKKKTGTGKKIKIEIDI